MVIIYFILFIYLKIYVDIFNYINITINNIFWMLFAQYYC